MDFKRKISENPMVCEKRNIPVLVFPVWKDIPGIDHFVTTREGGVSGDYFSSLNLRFGLGDPDEHVRENFRRVAEAIGAPADHFVLSDQTHTANVRRVTEEDAGKGLTRPRDYQDIDGLVTDVPGLVLSIFTADCVPVFFADPVHRAIGLAHSGWKGTAARISRRIIREMRQAYGSDPEDMFCAIGPSICMDCYEISTDVADIFLREFPGHEKEILLDKHNGHYLLDLWKSIFITLTDEGIRPSRIAVTDICTCENPERLFSHRASHGKRGTFGSFLMLKDA